MINDLTRHSLWLSRYYNGIFKDIEPELKKMRDEISQQILSSTPYQAERLSILLKEINAIIDRTTERIQPSLFDDFAEYEQQWTLKLLDKSTVASVVIGTGIATEQLKALIKDTPMTLEGKKPMTIEELVAYFNESAKKQIKEEITRGLVDGKTTDVIAKDILQFTKDKTFQQAKATVLTIANHVGNVAMKSVFEEHEELFKGERWHTVLDGRATPRCMSLSGKIFPIGKGIYPPLHYRCLTGDTLISTRYPISYVSKRIYQGAIYTIVTASGNSIRCTPNHPILTDRGFIDVQSINKSDKIATDLLSEGIRFVNNQDSKGITTIENLFSTLSKTSGVQTVTMPLTSEDFHGDVTDPKVDVVNINRELFFKLHAVNGKQVSHKGFVFASSFASTIGYFNKHLMFYRNSFSGFMTRFNLMLSLLFSHKRPFNGLLLRLVSYLNSLSFKFRDKFLRCYIHSRTNTLNPYAVLVKCYTAFKTHCPVSPVIEVKRNSTLTSDNSTDNLISDSKLFANITNGSMGDKVFFDNIIYITIEKNVLTHVYNLENDLGYYTANNLITHNCRSKRYPELIEKYKLDIDRTQSSQYGQVPSDWTYNDWLKHQSATVQNEILGEARANAYRKSGESISKFIDDGRFYTLSELKAKDLIN